MRTDPQRWKKRANLAANVLAMVVLMFLGYVWFGWSTWPLVAKAAVVTLAAPLAYFFVVSDAHFFVVSERSSLAKAQAAVVIRLALKAGEFGSNQERSRIQKATDKLAQQLDDSDVGYFDGDEYGQAECRLFMHGPDAESLFARIEGDIRREAIFEGAIVEMYLPNAKSPFRTATV